MMKTCVRQVKNVKCSWENNYSADIWVLVKVYDVLELGLQGRLLGLFVM